MVWSAWVCHSEVWIPTLTQEKDKVVTCPMGLGLRAASDGKTVGHCGTRRRRASGKGEPHPPPYPLSGHWEPLSANKTGQWCLDKLACSMPSRAKCQTLPTSDTGTSFHGYTAGSSSALTGYYCPRLWAWVCATQLYRHAPLSTSKYSCLGTITSVMSNVVPAKVNVSTMVPVGKHIEKIRMTLALDMQRRVCG